MQAVQNQRQENSLTPIKYNNNQSDNKRTMRDLFLSINDTVVTNSNSIAKQFKEMTETCLACAKESATNICDVDIAKQVSTTVIAVAAICAAAYLLSKLIAFWQTSRHEKRKREWDKEDKLTKLESEAWSMKLEWLKTNKKDDYIAQIGEYISETKASQKSKDIKASPKSNGTDASPKNKNKGN